MSQKIKLNLCIQVHPNELGIDYGRIALSPNTLQRLALLCGILGGYKLHSAACTKIRVQWYTQGQPWTADSDTTCTLWGSERDQDLCLTVDSTFWDEQDEHTGIRPSCKIHGNWWFLTLSALNRKNLLDQADEVGDIHASCDMVPRIEAVSRTAEFQRALFLERAQLAPPQTEKHKRWPWPDPFDHWQGKFQEEASARARLPRTFQSEARLPVADAVLTKLFQAFLTPDLNPNQRCAFYTLAAALIICPQEVTLARSNGEILLFLCKIDSETLPDDQHLRIEDLVPPSLALCGTRDYEFKFERVIRLGYKGIVGQINLDARQNVKAANWTTRRKIDDLALLYEDHANNDFARWVMRDFAQRYTDDLSRLKLLAFGLDSLKRLLDDGYPWYEDVRTAMENPDYWFNKSESATKKEKA